MLPKSLTVTNKNELRLRQMIHARYNDVMGTGTRSDRLLLFSSY